MVWGRNAENVHFADFVGKTFTEINRTEGYEGLIFVDADGEKYEMAHAQDCCESVTIDDICGDLKDLIDSPILTATEATSDINPNPDEKPKDASETWTFYRIATIKGSVVIRWYGSSNGYYSESVNIKKAKG